MIKEKAYEILDLLQQEQSIFGEQTKLQEEAMILHRKLVSVENQVHQKKQELGDIINPPPKGINPSNFYPSLRPKRFIPDIILEKDGKEYCLYFDSKYNTAGIKEVISVDEAEKRLMIKKIE